MRAFFLATIKVVIRCVDLTVFILFQIRNELTSCLTVRDAYKGQGTNRTAKLDKDMCFDQTRSPMAAVYQVGK